jgi:hypothetical protein
MHVRNTNRRTSVALSLGAVLALAGTGVLVAQRPRVAMVRQQRMPPPPMVPRRMGPPMGPGPNQGARGGHLGDWMNAHRNLSPGQQQQALQNEPGFRQLPPQTQQRYLDRLAQLNAMNPDKRQQLLNHAERMEQLTPDQRGQVRGAMQQLGSLPPDQRHLVARSFNELRTLPPEQRGGMMSRIPMNDAQRSALYNLMRVEPMLPRAEAAPRY